MDDNTQISEAKNQPLITFALFAYNQENTSAKLLKANFDRPISCKSHSIG